MNSRFVYILLICLLSVPLFAQQTPEAITIDGKRYTIHKVRTGETLYAISQQYQQETDVLRKVNRMDSLQTTIDAGSLLIVPLKRTDTTHGTAIAGTVTHVVKQGETLYSLTRDYNLNSPAIIKKVNKLDSDTLDIGQVLQIPKIVTHTDDTTALATADTTAADSAKAPLTLEERYPELDIEQLKELNRQYYSVDSATAVAHTKRGVGTWLEDYSQEGKKKFYALHKTEPAGTVLKVRHMLNNREVFVKVLGPLPDNDANRGTIVKLSAGAADYLGILDKRYLVEITTLKAGS